MIVGAQPPGRSDRIDEEAGGTWQARGCQRDVAILIMTVILICGPRRAGKSLLVRLLAATLLARSRWFLRVVPDGVLRDLRCDCPTTDSHLFTSLQCVHYSPDRIFEALPEAIGQIVGQDRQASVIIEADADPALRHAFPYDRRVFVLACPRHLQEVFRSPAQAAAAMKQVMQDTASFAAEMFGLFDSQAYEVHPQVRHLRCPGWRPDELASIDQRQLRQLLATPVGAEIASRIQLQPPYHGLIDSDLIVLNRGAGQPGAAAEQCAKRIDRLLRWLHRPGQGDSWLFCCDPADANDPGRARLVQRLAALQADGAA